MFRLSSCCLPWPLAISLPLLVVFTVFRPLVFRLLRSLLHISRLPAFPSVPICFCISFSPLVIFHEAKEISWHFIPQSAISRAEKPKRSFILYLLEYELGWEANEALSFCILGREAKKILLHFIPRCALPGLKSRKGLVIDIFRSVLHKTLLFHVLSFICLLGLGPKFLFSPPWKGV